MLNPEIFSLLEENYDLGPVIPQERYATNGQREAWLLTTRTGPLVLKITDPGRLESVVQSDTGILVYLADDDFPAPLPVPASGGQLYLPYRDRFLYLYTWVNGSYPVVSGSLYPRLGALLARLHSLPSNHFSRFSPYNPPEILAQTRAQLLSVVDQPGQGEMAVDLINKIDRFPSFEGLPLGLIHTDPYFVNLLEDGAGKLYLIDWEDAGISYPLLDVGYLGHLCTFLSHDCQKWKLAPEGEITWRPEWAQAFLDGYQSVRRLAPLEKDLFGQAVWLSFLVYIWEGNEQRIIPENYRRMKVLESFQPRW